MRCSPGRRSGSIDLTVNLFTYLGRIPSKWGVFTAEFGTALWYRDGLRSVGGRVAIEVRPLVDVVGERLGDMSAADILHLPV